MQVIMNCPVCGQENKRDFYTECIGIVEDHYHCKQCGYIVEMAYSPVFKGIVVPNNANKEEHVAKYRDKITELNLNVYDKKDVGFL